MIFCLNSLIDSYHIIFMFYILCYILFSLYFTIIFSFSFFKIPSFFWSVKLKSLLLNILLLQHEDTRRHWPPEQHPHQDQPCARTTTPPVRKTVVRSDSGASGRGSPLYWGIVSSRHEKGFVFWGVKKRFWKLSLRSYVFYILFVRGTLGKLLF